MEEFIDAVFSDDIYMFARHGNVTLRSFGIKPDSGELYMEIPICLPPADLGDGQQDDGKNGRQNGTQNGGQDQDQNHKTGSCFSFGRAVILWLQSVKKQDRRDYGLNLSWSSISSFTSTGIIGSCFIQ